LAFFKKFNILKNIIINCQKDLVTGEGKKKMAWILKNGWDFFKKMVKF
jgi:hypothetical protein